jgi:putative membrane-bound dehydrogenase-like protein
MHMLLQSVRSLSKAMIAALLLPAAAYGVPLDEALSTFTINPEFEIELVAGEPLVFDPVDMAFDEHGNAYVVEMPGYPFPSDNGRVVRLEDSDNDGVYDKRIVFAEGFAVADSLLPYDGGLLIASPPELVFVKDTDGDGAADVHDIVMRGFSLGNTQHNYNGLTYGLDNWIHAGNGGNSGSVKWGDAAPVSIRGNDFRFHMPTQRFELTGRTSGGFEIAFDAWGRHFQTHNTQHIYQLVFPGKFTRILPQSRQNTLTHISDHEDGGLGRIFPVGVQESRVNHPEQAGYFSGACGITYYGGGAFPEAYNGNVFVCDVVLNLIHRDVLSPDGAALKASRGRDRVEFLASTDRSFRPVNMAVGPDGALYVLDMHRDVIEHPEWIPDELEKDMDIDAGKDKGRIYRITPEGGLPMPRVEFDRSNPAYAVERLGHANQWWRTTAQRLLVEWNDAASITLLQASLADSNPLKRLHGMWTLEGIGELDDDTLSRLLEDDAGGVRENALQIAAERPRLRDAIVALADDSDGRVRLFAALALQGVEQNDEVHGALARILVQDVGDQWTRMAVAAGSTSNPSRVLEHARDEGAITSDDGWPAFVELVSHSAAMSATETEWAKLLGVAATSGLDSIWAAALEGVATGLEASQTKVSDPNSLLPIIRSCVEEDPPSVVRHALRLGRAAGIDLTEIEAGLLTTAKTIVTDSEYSPEVRVEQLGLVAFAPYDARVELLFGLLDPREPRSVQVAAIDQITNDGGTDDAERLIAMWPTLGPGVRERAGNFLLYRRPNNPLLLNALEDGRLKLGEMNFHLERRRHLLWADDKSIAARAEKLFSDAGVVTRAQAIEAMRPALKLTGDPQRGHAIYQERCAECHQIGTEGYDVGPNLTDIFRKSPEQLMHDILDPNSAAEPAYLAYTAVPAADNFDADIVSGLLVAETDDAITLRQAGGAETTFARKMIESFTTTGLSLMPEELEADLDHQAFADLLAFLLEPR